MNWFEGQTYCEKRGGQLATCSTIEHCNTVVERFRAQGFDALFWLGYHNINNKDQFEGVDGKTPQIKWDRGQPNPQLPHENCVGVYRNNGAHDFGCELRMTALCKRSLGSLKLEQRKHDTR
jgi:hypothetical protein